MKPDTDPDPEFQVNPDLDPGFNDQKMKKKIKLKIFLIFFFIKNCNLLIPRPP
jgi:hypothetical protein